MHSSASQMESEITFSYSATYSTIYLNSSEIPGKQTYKWTNAEIDRLIQIIVRPILLIIGTVGNILTGYIMRRTSMKDVSSCFYMFLLALADTR